MIKMPFLFFVSFVGIYLSVWFLMMSFSAKSGLKERKRATKFPTVSILVPAYNEAMTLPKTLNSLLRLDYPKSKLEAVVIDNGSTDSTLEVAKKFAAKEFANPAKSKTANKTAMPVRVFSLPVRSKVKALNLGLKHAKGGLIGVLDADTSVAKDCLRRMVGYFDDGNVGAVTNCVKVAHSNTLLSAVQEMEYALSAFSKKLISLLDALYVVPGTLSLIRRDVIDRIGFSSDTMTEDMDIALCMLKKNYRIASALDAVSYTEVPSSFIGLLRQRVRWYRGFIQNIRKHSDIVFNKAYPHLGYFILPFSSLLAISVGAVLTVVLLFNLIQNTVIFAKDIAYMPFLEKIAMSFGSFSLNSLIIDPYSTITYTTILMGSFIVLVVSFRALKVKFRKRFMLLPVYFFIYYSLIMVFWMVSAFMELIGWKKKW